ncbi:MAG: hypothetical protein AB8B85_05875 [Paracoccaceae bacterium]
MTVMLGDEKSFMPPRRLRVFAFDPGTGNKFQNRSIRTITITLPWEFDPSDPKIPFWGPRGEYLEVVDYDPASGVFYEPINLNAQEVLLNDGLPASEEDPRFHQQMVYAVAMETIQLFEQALGRRVLWAPRKEWPEGQSYANEHFCRRLRIYPHALREANAYYDPRKKALLFGYFKAGRESRAAPPGTTVFTCLSHDIIVHETCHAILDGLHPRYAEASHPDMLALHEAFSDIVALFQQFSHPEVLANQIARTRGDLNQQSLLASLAQEFGEAVGRGGALRDALGSMKDGKWVPRDPDPRALMRAKGPHARGSILVAAVFRAFLTIYESRTADLFRIASQGSGILRNGAIDPDLVERLAREAAQSARHVLQMCIRAMDYCPPVSVSFGDYLRALITADHDLYPVDENGYRRAFIEAFSAWGLYPDNIPVLTENALLWPSLTESIDDALANNDVSLGDVKNFNQLIANLAQCLSRPFSSLKKMAEDADKDDGIEDDKDKQTRIPKWFAEGMTARGWEIMLSMNERLKKTTENWIEDESMLMLEGSDQVNLNLLELDLNVDREFAWDVRGFYAQLFWGIVAQWPDPVLNLLGIATSDASMATLKTSSITGKPTFDVFSVRIARRIGKRGQQEREYVVELIQSRDGYLDKELQDQIDRTGKDRTKRALTATFKHDHGRAPGKAEKDEINRQIHRDFRYRAGCTLLIDARTFKVRRVIRTRHMADDEVGLCAMRAHLDRASENAMNAFDAPEGTGDTSRAFAMLHRHVHPEGNH